jgi:hypothetical protein
LRILQGFEELFKRDYILATIKYADEFARDPHLTRLHTFFLRKLLPLFCLVFGGMFYFALLMINFSNANYTRNSLATAEPDMTDVKTTFVQIASHVSLGCWAAFGLPVVFFALAMSVRCCLWSQKLVFLKESKIEFIAIIKQIYSQ